MQGARTMRTSTGSTSAARVAIRASEPASMQLIDSQTRMVVGAGGVWPSWTTSKWS